MEQAKAAGAMALFGEKYGDSVRMLTMGSDDFSIELCGGTHVKRTGDIGLFRIVSEGGIAAGVRRIEALTGAAALADITAVDHQLVKTAALVKTQPDKLVEKLQQLLDQQKALEKELTQLKREAAGNRGNDLLSEVQHVNEVALLIAAVDGVDAKALREMHDQVKQKLRAAAIVLAGIEADKIALIASVSDELIAKVKAGDLIKALAAATSGKGGGKPSFAQGGGTDVGALPDALAALREQLQHTLSA